MNATTISDLQAESLRLKQAAKRIDEMIVYLQTNFPLTALIETAGDRAKQTDWSKLSHAEACYLVLFDSQSPMSRQEIIAAAAKKHKVIKGPEHISPVLSKDNRFISVGGGKWDLRENVPTDLLSNLNAKTKALVA